MPAYDLERFSILVVEDSLFIRSIVQRALRALGVGMVNSASNGAEAIDLMRRMTKDAREAGLLAIDIMITDWVMPQVDGLMLTRWVRRHKESPDRFMPILMLTANTDRDNVAQARDAGVTELMTKPFSTKTLTEKIQAIIENPRQFVQAPGYFGPERRRRPLQHQGAERRVTSDAEIEVHYVG
jgi:two-component system chemotaxis response regulator CheY